MKTNYLFFWLLLCGTLYVGTTAAQPQFSLVEVGSTETAYNTVTCVTHEIDGTHYIYSGGDSDKIDVIKVSPEGGLEVIATTTTFGKTIRGLIVDEIAGKDYLFAGVKGADGLQVYDIKDDGTLTEVFTLKDTEQTYLGIVITLQVIHMENASYLFVGGLEKQPGLSSFKILPNGHLEHVQSLADTKTLFMDGIIAMSIHRVEGKTFLFTGGFHDNGLSSFEVYEDGHFENRDNLGDDATHYLNGTYPLISATLGGRHYVVVGHRHHIYYEPSPWIKDRESYYYHGDAVSVFMTNEQGEIIPRSVFQGNATTLIKGQTRLQSLPIDDKHELVAVATRDDKSIQLCVLDHKGRLIDAGNLMTGLPVYYGLTGAKMNDDFYLFIGSVGGKEFKAYRLEEK